MDSLNGPTNIIDEYNQKNNQPITEDEDTKPNPFRVFVYKRKNQLIALLIVVSCIVAGFVFYTNDNEVTHKKFKNTCLINANYRISCGNFNISKDKCRDINCCFDTTEYECYHYYPSTYGYSESGNNNYKPLEKRTPLQTPMLTSVELTISHNGETSQIVVSESATGSNVVRQTSGESEYFTSEIDKETLSIKILRKKTGDVLLSSKLGPLITSNGYWEWSLQVTQSLLFGLNDLHLKNKRLTRVIYKNSTEHNVIPAFIAHQSDKFHGVVINHEGPLEVTILASKLIVLRGLGKNFDVTLFHGPTPKDIYRQMKTNYPIFKYEHLRPHICRDGNAPIEDVLKEIQSFYAQNNIKLASDCLHENLYMLLNEMNDDTKAQLQTIIQQLSTKFVLSLPPHIIVNEANDVYQKAVDLQILYKNSDSVAKGSYKDRTVVYPDFSHEKVADWIAVLEKYLEDAFKAKPHGLIFRDNWPADDSFEMEQLDIFPYLPDDLQKAMSGSLSWNAVSTTNISHYQVHNYYGKEQVEAFKDSKVFGTASFTYGIAYPAVAENVDGSWIELRKSLKTTLAHSLFGNPYVSIPVCGSTKTFDESACIRWYIMAASMPIFRISSETPRRDPLSLPSKYAQNIALDAISKREMLLAHYYTILKTNEPIVRPMFYQFPNDRDAYNLEEQYMIGNSLLVAQSVLPSATSLRIYLPKEVNAWFEFWGGIRYKNGWTNFGVVESDWNMFIAAGHVVVVNQKKAWKIVTALDCSQSPCYASGKLDFNGATLTFDADETSLTVNSSTTNLCDNNDEGLPTLIQYLAIYGNGGEFTDPLESNIDLCTISAYPYTFKYP